VTGSPTHASASSFAADHKKTRYLSIGRPKRAPAGLKDDATAQSLIRVTPFRRCTVSSEPNEFLGGTHWPRKCQNEGSGYAAPTALGTATSINSLDAPRGERSSIPVAHFAVPQRRSNRFPNHTSRMISRPPTLAAARRCTPGTLVTSATIPTRWTWRNQIIHKKKAKCRQRGSRGPGAGGWRAERPAVSSRGMNATVRSARRAKAGG
jgi:hypothetical protein